MAAVPTLQVDLVAQSNLLLSGTTQNIDGETASAGKIVFAVGQTTTSENGPWVVGTPWVRLAEFDAAAEVLSGTGFRVRGGSVDNKGSLWSYNGPDGAVVGTDPLTFQRDTWGPGALAFSGGLSRTGRDVSQGLSGVDDGEYHIGPLRLAAEAHGLLTGIEAGYGQGSFIEGLALFFTATNTLAARSGGAWIPGTLEVLDFEETGVGLSPAGSAVWEYFYLSATGVVVKSPAAPDTPYEGYARTQTGNTNRRYIQAAKVAASGVDWLKFTVEGNGESPFVRYLEATNAAPFRVLSSGTATTSTNVDCSAVVPPTARLALVRLLNTDTTRSVLISNSGVTTDFAFLTTSADKEMVIPLDSLQRFQYRYSSTGAAGLHADVLGYWERR